MGLSVMCTAVGLYFTNSFAQCHNSQLLTPLVLLKLLLALHLLVHIAQLCPRHC
jgi:hypothetical protein